MIQTMTLKRILRDYGPGSFDRSWTEEFADLASPARIGEVMDYLIPSILLSTWDVVEPVVLGWDGRVWGGHKRIFLAHQFRREWMLVDPVEPGDRRPADLVDCAPPEGVY